MKTSIRVILSITLLVMSGSSAYGKERPSAEQENIDQLISKFWDLSYGEWGSLSETFHEMGDALIEPLTKMLRDIDTSSWSQYRIEWHQRRIAWVLGKVGTERAISLLIEMLQDKTLHDYGRNEAAMTLRRIRAEKAIDPLIMVLNDKKSNPPPRSGAAYALGDLQAEKAVPALIKSLGEENNQIRMGAVYGLGHIGTDEAVDGLLQALQDRTGTIRRQTYSYLIRLLPDKKSEFLILALKDEDWGVREDSVKALVEIGESMLEHVIPLLTDENNVVRWESVRIMGKIQLEENAEMLIEALKDRDWMVRNEAAVALVRINSGNTIEPLIRMLENENRNAREEAAWILGEMRLVIFCCLIISFRRLNINFSFIVAFAPKLTLRASATFPIAAPSVPPASLLSVCRRCFVPSASLVIFTPSSEPSSPMI